MIIRQEDLRALNSITKYPSIPTYHSLDPANGNLIEDRVTTFPDTVIGTEKIDGTNGRIIVIPGGGYIIGSREELLYASGDLLTNPALGIVEALRPVAEKARGFASPNLQVFYLEVYGGKIGKAAKYYSRDGQRTGCRLFDHSRIDEMVVNELLTWPAEDIARWRDDDPKLFVSEGWLGFAAEQLGVELAPRLFELEPQQLPQTLDDCVEFLKTHVPTTRVALDDEPRGDVAEGIVLRTEDRSTVAKMRFEDYLRTLRRRGSQS